MRLKDLKEVLKSGHLATLLSAFLYFAVSFMVWGLIGVLAVHIAATFGLTAGQKGLLVAIPLLGGSLVRVPLGIFVDRIGPRQTGMVCQGIVMISLLWGWLGGHRFSEMLGIGLLLGVAGGSFAVALPLASRWYPPQHQGLVMGVTGAGNSGIALAALLAPRLAEGMGWHPVFGLALIPVGVTAILYALLAKESPSKRSPKSLAAYLGVCRQPDMLWFCLLYGFTFGGFVGLASFLVIFLHDQYGLTRVMAGNATALCLLAGSLSRPIGGYLADRFGGTRMLTVLLVGGSFGLVGMALLPPLWLAILFLFFLMACLGMGNGSVFQLVPQRFREEIGAATGIVGAAGGLGGFLLPNLLGWLKETTGSYGNGLLCFSAAGFICVALLKLMQRQWRLSWMPETPAPVLSRVHQEVS